MPLPVIIVTGFLGCGKTSFLCHLLPLCGEAGLRPALIINEVGDIDVDGELLADLHSEQVRLVGGCVCCTLQGQLTGTIYDLLEEKKGDCIIIECSGLSNPLDVLGALSAPALLREIAVSHIVCLLDAKRADKILRVTELAKTQIATADVVILNKADTVTAKARPAAAGMVHALSPHAELRWAQYGDIGAERLRALLTDPAPVRCACGCDHDHHHHDHAHSLPASFCTVALPLPACVNRSALAELLAALPENVIRAKGFANLDSEGWHVLHRVYDAIDITPFAGPAPASGAMLVCIGQHMEQERLQALVDKMPVVAHG